MIVLNRMRWSFRPSHVIPFEMIDEDLHTARRRALRWEELNERRTAIHGLMREVRQKLDAARVRESAEVAKARLGAYARELATVERELAEVGPAKELYGELLLREERRLTGSADPRGAELLEIRRLLAELDVELPAGERAKEVGLEVMNGAGEPEEEAVVEFAGRVEALGLMSGPTAVRAVTGDQVEGVVERIEERCRDLARLRDRLRARREEILLG